MLCSPGLTLLTEVDKDALIVALFGQLRPLAAQVEMLTARVRELEGMLSKNSRNSSKPCRLMHWRRRRDRCGVTGRNPSALR